MFASVSASATHRFNEVRLLLNQIKSIEVPPPGAEPDVASIFRGLFFVHLYGAFEHSITFAVQSLLQGVAQVNVPYAELTHLFHAIALDAKFTAVAAVGHQKRCSARRELLLTQQAPTACGLNDAIFQKELKNIWYETLVDIFDHFCISAPVFPDRRFQGYIDEIVNSRNAVAHGRESPTIIGKRRSADLEIRFDAIVKTTFHVIFCFNQHLADRGFVAPAYRAQY